MNFQAKLKQIRELAGLDENVKSLLEKMTGKELVSYEGIDALVAALMTFYNGELKKKISVTEFNEKFKNFCPFPVNSLYISLGNENPSSLWLGTTWQKQENRFLLGAGSSYNLGSTGGSNSISLSANNMPRHRHRVDQTSASVPPHAHNVKGMAGWAGDTGYITMQSKVTTQGIVSTESAGGGSTGSFAPYTDYQGNGSAFSIMPPYLAVNIWKRTS